MHPKTNLSIWKPHALSLLTLVSCLVYCPLRLALTAKTIDPSLNPPAPTRLCRIQSHSSPIQPILRSSQAQRKPRKKRQFGSLFPPIPHFSLLKNTESMHYCLPTFLQQQCTRTSCVLSENQTASSQLLSDLIIQFPDMSSRRTRSRQDRSVRISDEQITDLVNKLQALLPDVGERRPVSKVQYHIARALPVEHYCLQTSYRCALLLIGIGVQGVGRDMQLYQELAQRGGGLERKAGGVAGFS